MQKLIDQADSLAREVGIPFNRDEFQRDAIIGSIDIASEEIGREIKGLREAVEESNRIAVTQGKTLEAIGFIVLGIGVAIAFKFVGLI